MIDLNHPSRYGDDEMLVRNTVNDMIAESYPGTEGRSREELEAIVRHVHEETVGRVLARELQAVDAAAYEWRRFSEELGK